MMPIIQVTHLKKQFGGKVVLRDINFLANRGEVVALLGPNGAGKSTLLRILATISRPTTGEIKISGYNLPAQAASIRLRLGVITHQTFLYGDLTAKENLLFYARFYGIKNPETRIDEIIHLVDLSARRNDLVRTYSRGMQQRLSIGRAILHNPDIFLLDEPHTGLDINGCELLDKLISQLARDGRTILFSSHDLTNSEKAATRFVVLNRGVIIRSGRKTDIKNGLVSFYREAISEMGHNARIF